MLTYCQVSKTRVNLNKYKRNVFHCLSVLWIHWSVCIVICFYIHIHMCVYMMQSWTYYANDLYTVCLLVCICIHMYAYICVCEGTSWVMNQWWRTSLVHVCVCVCLSDPECHVIPRARYTTSSQTNALFMEMLPFENNICFHCYYINSLFQFVFLL